MTDREIIAKAKEVYEQDGRLIVWGDPVYPDDEECSPPVIDQLGPVGDKPGPNWEGAWVMAWVFVPNPNKGVTRDEV